MFYMAWNRILTTRFFFHEWNSFGSSRKGLRVTDQEGAQRKSHFLQQPFRWAIPLIVVSSLLHWLLSQSFFLVRIEVYDGGIDNGDDFDETLPQSAIGYSSLSMLVFCVAFLLLIAVIYMDNFRTVRIQIPPALHCSLVISAACHPPPDDVNPHLEPVHWGVVRSRFGGKIAHCSFTSEEVTAPKDGDIYG